MSDLISILDWAWKGVWAIGIFVAVLAAQIWLASRLLNIEELGKTRASRAAWGAMLVGMVVFAGWVAFTMLLSRGGGCTPSYDRQGAHNNC